MQPIASTSAPTPPRLTEPNLHNHTRIEGIAPRRTVQIYLQSIKQADGYFELPPPPLDESRSPPARLVDRPLNLYPHPNEPESKRRRLEDEDEGTRDTALVMHHSEVRKKEKDENIGIRKPESAPLKKKPSLVSAMRARLTSLPNKSSSPLRKDGKEKEKGKGSERKRDVGTTSGFDELLDFEEGEKENHRKRDAGNKRKGKGKAVENSKEKSEKGKGKLRTEPENEKEADELEDRLEARNERRRNKAFIRKDRSQSAAATGAAAASKLTITGKKKRERGEEESESEASEGRDRRGKKKGRRKTAEQDGREQIQDLSRPAGVGKGRLTVKPPTKLGIFNKGKASSRTRVGHAIPDLAFSEMTFLNSTRLGADASSSSLSSVDSELPDPRTLGKMSKATSGRKTYGSKQKLRRHSSANIRLESASSAASYPAEPLPHSPHSPRRPQSKRKKTPPARQATPKKPRRISSRTARLPRSPSPSPVRTTLASPQVQRPALDQEMSPPQPPQEALEFAARDESGFSAHSAHSLALRHRSARDREEVAARQIARGTIEEEVTGDFSPAPIEQTANNPRYSPTPALVYEETALADGSLPVDQQMETSKRSLSDPSLNTASMERLAFDNLSVVGVQQTLQPGSGYARSNSLPLSNPRSLLLPNRSRSTSAAPSDRAPDSAISRQRSMSQSAVSYVFDSANPFLPFNFGDHDSSSNGSLDAPEWRTIDGTEVVIEGDIEDGMDVEPEAEYELALEEEEKGVDEGGFASRFSRFERGGENDETFVEIRDTCEEVRRMAWPTNTL